MLDFITIDFETATGSGDSPCEIGLTFVRDGRITGSYGRLIRPPGNRYDYWNTKIHGIRPEETAHEPSFADLWPELAPMLDNRFLIAHNASFDFSVLRSTLVSYRLPVPSLMYACSVQLSKKIWKGLPKYNLKALCDLHGIDFNHHRAEADSLATARLCIKAFSEAGIESENDIREKLKTNIWQMRPGGNVRLNMPTRKKAAEMQALEQSVKVKPGSLFYKKKVVFTGTLSTMKRLEALQEILDLGGFPEEKVTEETDFLVVGRPEMPSRSLSGLSQKQRLALELITKGAPIRFISEPEFIHQLEYP